jgi:hypothetical protein
MTSIDFVSLAIVGAFVSVLVQFIKNSFAKFAHPFHIPTTMTDITTRILQRALSFGQNSLQVLLLREFPIPHDNPKEVPWLLFGARSAISSSLRVTRPPVPATA